MQISAPQGTLLSLLVGVTQACHVVEVGTFTGFSALCLARALPAGGRLLCCDISEEWTAVGRRYWARAGVADKIDLRIGPALDTLSALPRETRFDLAFVDADKPGYDAYYEALLPLMRQNALFVFDNMLRGGTIEDAASEDAVALNALNRKLATDPRVESVLLPFCRRPEFRARPLTRLFQLYQSAWKMPGLSTRSKVCAPKKSRWAWSRLAGRLAER